MKILTTNRVKALASATCFAALMLPQAALANATISDINMRLLNAVRTAPIPPPRMSRAIAMVNLSVFDAVNAGSAPVYRGYNYNGARVLGASTDALAISAGYTMMGRLFPSLTAGLDMEMNTKLDALSLSESVRTSSVAFGQSVANNFFNARLSDGSEGAQVPYIPDTGVGDFQPIGGNPPVLPLWGNVTTFAATSATQFSPGAPPPVGSAE